MCGRFYIPEGDLDDFAGLVSKIEKELLKKAGEIFPGDYAPVITPNRSQQDSNTDQSKSASNAVHAIKWDFRFRRGDQ